MLTINTGKYVYPLTNRPIAHSGRICTNSTAANHTNEAPPPPPETFLSRMQNTSIRSTAKSFFDTISSLSLPAVAARVGALSQKLHDTTRDTILTGWPSWSDAVDKLWNRFIDVEVLTLNL